MKFLLLSLLIAAAILTAADHPASTPYFADVAQRLGITALFPQGGTVNKQYIIETTGSGLGFIDYDNDGWPDLLVLSGEGGRSRMFHNEEHGARFRDVTGELHLDSTGWSQGVCAADYDNDGWTDLFITSWGQNHLYRNINGKYFQDVTAAAYLTQPGRHYNTGCAFTDIDNDGHVDLFVANYLQFDPSSTPKPGANPYCYYRGVPVACGPRGLPFERNWLYRNEGNGTFTDISQSSGIASPEGHYGLGVLAGDFTEDGLPDIYVACDQTPSLLYVNQGHGRFAEEAVLRGVAFDGNGKEMSGMGVDAADYTGDGHIGLFRTNFSDEFETLYRNRGNGNFDDVTMDMGLARNTRFVGWGTGFFDYDLDGWKDLFLVNGHAFPEVDRLGIDVHFRDRAILYHNQSGARFIDVSDHAGPAILAKHSSRGAAFADINGDGRLEIAVNNQGESPAVLLDESPRGSNHWLSLQLEGRASNRSAIGARVRVRTGSHLQFAEVRSGGSYLSQNGFRLHFGLGTSERIDEIRVYWPSGRQISLPDQAADQVLKIVER